MFFVETCLSSLAKWWFEYSDSIILVGPVCCLEGVRVPPASSLGDRGQGDRAAFEIAAFCSRRW